MVSGGSPVGGWSLLEAKQGPGGGREEMEPTAHLSLPHPRPTPPSPLLGRACHPVKFPPPWARVQCVERTNREAHALPAPQPVKRCSLRLHCREHPGVRGSSAWRRRSRCDASGRARLVRAQGSWCSGHGTNTARTVQLPAPGLPSSPPHGLLGRTIAPCVLGRERASAA